ncbi:PucR family transcriptional regulator [Microbacterium sp.]|uniref:PucR family transcriptional regulator n=1 Tax=Microbacterium sp. TaxID=51671 RepID=UPI0028121E2C|nr:PucR family transcriptional regulator ligand-binding domain-containing protein [Microbacterium sp.]
MVPLHSLLVLPGLGLRLVVGVDSPEVEIRWAHVSELNDPTPWLEGGELLLTTGLSASWEGEDALRYCQRLVDRGVVALGVSTGSDLTHQAIPADLLSAAERTGLRLVHVPHLTPLQAVVRAVADEISSASERPLRSQVELQQKLMLEAASGSGLSGATERIRTASGLWVSVHDARLRKLAGPADSVLGEELRRRIRRQLMRDRQGSISIQEDADRSAFILPLVGDGRVRGYAVATKDAPFTVEERSLLKVAAPILGLLLDLREAAESPLRQARGAAAASLISAREGAEHLQQMLRAARLAPSRTQVARVRTRSVAQRRALMAGLIELADDALALNDQDQTALVLCDPVPDLPERFLALAEEIELEDVGLGEPGSIERTPESHIEAMRAQGAARMMGMRVATAPQQGCQLSRILSDAERLAEFSRSVLAPLESHDRDNPRLELLPTLRAYFDAIASIETAAGVLGIHRHTMRARLRKIGEVSGYDLTQPGQYLELWLAVELRGRLPG